MLGMLRAIAFVAVWAGVGFPSAVAGAGALGSPTGPIILAISGNIGLTNAGDEVHFDRLMLEGLGLRELRTETPWTDGIQVFEGVLVARILEVVGATGTLARATALNDYSVDIDLSFAKEERALIALRMNGEYMRVRDKGPLWIVFPWEQMSAIQEELVKSLSIWQLSHLEIR